MATTTAPRRASQVKGRRPGGGIRWDRLGRLAVLVLIGAILLLYISPAKHWWEQSRTAASQSEELQRLETENAELTRRAKALSDPDQVELEARRLGMVELGEKPFVVLRGKER